MFVEEKTIQIKGTFIRECLSKAASHPPANGSVLKSASVQASAAAPPTNK